MLGIYRFIAAGFGAGYSPFAPGTAGAVMGLALLAVWQHFVPANYFPDHYFIPLVVVTLIFNFVGVYVTDKVEPAWGSDPSRVVIDEIVGMWIAILWIPPNWTNWLIAFALFRFFDIAKPLGIRKLEEIKGGWGVMLDDVLAGIYANLVLQVIIRLPFFP
ncbi:MAG: phosphatidylglycerophosphatase A [Bacteroidetes bacterium]|nr:phosphatidylglycerophosphatase A [Bacteroidota bacterium]MDA1119311.1 phosphatidylglycerophosphatase A [Bacteroidota bacterium]